MNQEPLSCLIRETHVSPRKKYRLASTSVPVLQVNGKSYRRMARPAMVVCVDSCDSNYITASVWAWVAPYSHHMTPAGSAYSAECGSSTALASSNSSVRGSLKLGRTGPPDNSSVRVRMRTLLGESYM